jgi:FixJ family two-component response regulator
VAQPIVHIVDDDDSVRKALMRLMGACGFGCKAYASSEDFLLHSRTEGADCLVVDWSMPGGLDLAHRHAAWNERAPLPVIYISGDADMTANAEGTRHTAVALLAKPLDSKTLIAAVTQALRRDPRPQIT